MGFLLTSVAACALNAQAPIDNTPTKQVSAPQIKVETRVVLVDVVVTNHKGESIPDLQRSDFAITEDGRSQVISAFEEHKRVSAEPKSLPPLPANVYTNAQAVKPSDSVNILLIDLLNTYPWFQKDVCNQAIKYLKSVPPGTRLAIFTLNADQLRLVRGFTTDFSGLSAALDDKKSGVIPESDWLNPTPSRQGAELKGLENMIMMQASPAATNAVKQYLGEETATRTAARSELTLEAFQHLARYLAGIPARKNVVWLANTFPISFVPDEDRIHAAKHQEQVQQTSDMLTAAQVAIYPVSARGLAGDPRFDASKLEPGLLEELRITQIAIETVAEETGGRAFYNTNGLDAAMGRAVDEGSHYYTLAYSPTNSKTDGKYRRIDVKVPEENYRLSYRRGYYADKPLARDGTEETAEKVSDDPLIPLVGFGMPNFDQITYEIRALPVQPQPAPDAHRAGLNTELKGPFTRYGIDVSVSLRDFAFETTPDGVHHGRIEAMLVAYNRTGKVVNIAKLNSRLALKPEDYSALQARGLPFHLEIDVPTGDIYLRTGVYDLGSGNAGTFGFPLAAERPTPGVTK